MSDLQLNDPRHEAASHKGKVIPSSAFDQFYNFATQCMDWANTTRFPQERAIYTQMALQWLTAGARLQTFAQLKNSGASQQGSPART
jgi:hypothetical protein